MQAAAEAQADTAAQALIESCRTVIDALDRWAEEDLDFIIEHNAGDALNALSAIAMSRFPTDNAMMDLFIKVHDLVRHWRDYCEQNIADSAGLPVSAFWDAVKDVMAAMKYAELPQRPPLETVQELWRQLKDYPRRAEQIARMYGYTSQGIWCGPFFDARGMVLHHLVEKEANEPHSVLPADWVPPSEKARREKEAKIAEENMKKVRLLMQKQANRPKASDLIHEGQFPDVIARVCGMTEPEVRKLAAQMGVEVREREEYLDARNTIAAADPEADARGFVETDTPVAMTAVTARPTQLKPISDDSLRLSVVEMLAGEPDLSQGSILSTLAERGYKVSSGEVRKILKSLRE